ncbi:MAG: hypothetical protein IJF61_03590 [Clostridia bacterium]|nr:hypothetical protein [Clostridia bacterium]
MNDVRDILNIKIESPYWDEAYAKALSEPAVPEWMTEAYIRALHEEKGVLPRRLDTILSVLPHAVAVPELCLLAKTLYHIIGTKKSFSEAFTEFELPKAPDTVENTLGYDCFAIFPVLAHIIPTWNELKERDIPDEVLTASLHWADTIFVEWSERAGKTIFHEEEFKLYKFAVYVNNLTVGRLRFEIHENSSRPVRIFKNKKNGTFCPLMDGAMIHKSGHILGSMSCKDEEGSYPADFVETEDAFEGYPLDENTRLAIKKRVRLLKSEWEQVYASGDTVLKVHIPHGGAITPEVCKDSYKRGKELFARCFPEYKFKCFLICCWTLSPVLKEILPPESNIIAFQNSYVVYPMKNPAMDVFLYVYNIEANSLDDIAVAELPENNTLQRGVKQKTLEGKYIHQFGGYMPM